MEGRGLRESADRAGPPAHRYKGGRPLKAHLAARRTMRTRLAPGEKPHRNRMATLACVFDADPAIRLSMARNPVTCGEALS